ncbi:hypothetical protein AC062_1278 [Pasteurellaceae bacterium NI1060]|nr:hypothetical protein AC062_1278 [Pasteurellaceae bacterium NI1060]
MKDYFPFNKKLLYSYQQKSAVKPTSFCDFEQINVLPMYLNKVQYIIYLIER